MTHYAENSASEKRFGIHYDEQGFLIVVVICFVCFVCFFYFILFQLKLRLLGSSFGGEDRIFALREAQSELFG